MGRRTSRGEAIAARGDPRGGFVLGGCAVALSAFVLAIALGFEAHDAFWLDESWSGAIVSRPTWAEALRHIYWDVNAPLYELLLRAWAQLAGLSDAALRAPSLLCAALVPPALALAATPGLTRGRRLTWAALVGLWFPALCFAEEARCYALLLLVTSLQTAAFVRLLARPDLARATLWAALAAVAILVHYDALYLGAAQGLVYLARGRMRAVRTWPAALAFAPAFGWLVYHWPRIRLFAAPAIAWYAPLRPAQLHAVADYLAGGPIQLQLLGALALSALSLRLALPPARADARASAEGDLAGPAAAWLAVAASALAAAAMVGVGFLRPSFAYRYLTPEAPGLMLGVVLVAPLLAGRRAAPFTLAASAVALTLASVWMLAHGQRMAPRRYNFEIASRALAASRPRRLVFLWDHPVDPVLHPEQLSALGGFFLRRDGVPVHVEPVIVHPGEDPNAQLAQAADGAAILWLYDTWVHGTAAIAHRPDFARLEPAGRCRNYGRGRFGVVACAPAVPSPAR